MRMPCNAALAPYWSWRPRRTSRVILAFALFLLMRPVFAQTAAARPEARYDAVELGGLASKNFSFVRGLNVSGQVAGLSGESNGTDSRAVLWTPDGVEILGTLPGGDSSASTGVNNSGHVVGTSNTATVVRAFLWTKYGGMQDLGTLPGDKGSEAFHINNVGQVVGSSSGPRGIRAVLWQANGLVQLLGTLPGGDFSRAVAINDSGEVTGTSGSASGTRAFFWTNNGGLRDLGTLPGHTRSEALEINNSGQVVGHSSGPGGTRAFLWTRSGGMKDLGTLPGGDYSRALGINDAGQVVGTSTSFSGARAFLWTAAEGMQDLNASMPDGVQLAEAYCINGRGQIAALSGSAEHVSTLGHDHEEEHAYRVFLLTPR